MILFNTFSNMSRYKTIPEADILVWAAALAVYKSFGYTLKLYCLDSDIDFLKQYHLYELYDIIDTEYLKNNKQLEKIDNKLFWSSRKIEAMYHELFDLNEEAIYTDVDILMKVPFDISNCDALVWSPEPRNAVLTAKGIDWTKTIYVAWKFLSKPKDYKMPKYILDMPDAYNCGVWYFKNKEVFLEFRKQYYDFCIGNPGKLIGLEDTLYALEGTIAKNAIFPCNAEQRILKAVLTEYKQNVKTIMPYKGVGLCKEGYHLFWYRSNWQFIEKNPKLLTPESLRNLNGFIFESLQALAALNRPVYEFFKTLPWLNNFELNFLKDPNKTPIKHYY